MSTLRSSALMSTAALAIVALAGCSAPAETEPSGEPAATVEIEATNGTLEVPVSPERVVALDNTSFETLLAWDITPVAVPKGLLPAEGFEEWIEDEGILDVGTHSEPDLEAVAEAEPDLIVGGYRFTDYESELESIAPVVDLAGNDEFEGGWIESLRHQTEQLGLIFDREDDAAELLADFDAAYRDAQGAVSGESVFLAVVSGGQLDNGAGRIGRVIEGLDLQDVFADEAGDVHGDSGLAPETIAQANPDWAIVLDRDAAVESDVTPAAAVLGAQEALAQTTFMAEGHVIYLDPFFYTREGLQAYQQAYEQITDAFTA